MKLPVMPPTALVFFAALALLATSAWREDKASPFYAALVFGIGGMYAGRWMKTEPPDAPSWAAAEFTGFNAWSPDVGGYLKLGDKEPTWTLAVAFAGRFDTVQAAERHIHRLRAAWPTPGYHHRRLLVIPVGNPAIAIIEPKEKHAES